MLLQIFFPGGSSLGTIRECAAQEIIVKFKPAPVQESRKLSLLKILGAKSIHGTYKDVFKIIDVPEGSMKTIIQALQKNPDIEYAEPNHTVKAFSIPNDEYYSFQWNFSIINLEKAWDYSTGEDITVAVLDSGINSHGRDGFGLRLLNGYNALISRESRWEDFNFHGTHVAGTIGQETNNGTGVAGIAFHAHLLPVKVLNRMGFGTIASVASGIRWATDHGADIINMSLGDSEGAQTLLEAIDYAYGKGVLLVAASGNDSSAAELNPVSYPAAYDHVLAVGAVDYTSSRSFYSNGGPELDVVAPGGDLENDVNSDGYADGVLQETFVEYLGFSGFAIDWNYRYLQGTSMAAPHVTGVAALIKSLHPAWGPDEITEALIQTAKDLGPAGKDDQYGYGLIDASAAVVY